MSSAALLDADLSNTTVATCAAVSPLVVAERVIAPARCDVHAVAGLEHRLAAVPLGQPVVIDLSEVVFLDLAAARFLRSLAEPGHPRRVGLSQLSAAARITYELLDAASARAMVAVAA